MGLIDSSTVFREREKPAQKTPTAPKHIMPALRCANPDCNELVGQAHFYGTGGVFRIFACAKCGRGSEFINTPEGITAAPMPKR